MSPTTRVLAALTTIALASIGLVAMNPAPSATAATAPDGVLGSFSSLGTGVNNIANSVVLHRGIVYFSGGFTAAGGVPGTNRVAAWSPASDTWAALGVGTNGDVVSLAAADDTIYAAGQFTSASGVPNTTRIAAWSTIDDTWHALGIGSSGNVEGVAAADDTVYIGGYLTSVSGVADTDYVAAWSNADDTWHALGAGLSSGMYSFLIDDDTVYVGGDFSNASGVPGTNKLAAWSYADDTWHALGVGTSHTTYAFAADDDTVYAGGYFSTASGVAGTDKIAAFSYTDDTWHPISTGLNETVATMHLDARRDLLYVGGAFTAANGGPAWSLKRFAVWDRGISAWIPTTHAAGNGVGVNSGSLWEVYDLAVDDSRVYLAGNFQNAGGIAAADYVAVWQWDAPEGSNTVSADVGTTVTITGEGFIGVPATGGVKFGSTPVSYIRDDSATITATVPAGVFNAAPITIDGAGGWGDVGTFTSTASALPDTPTPAVPASPPTDISGVAGDRRVSLNWAAPTSTGSFPVTTYQVTSSPSGGMCLTTTLACEITGLRNGTDYTFTVRALTGAGWSPWSQPSSVLIPHAPITPTILITGSRGEVRGKPGVVVTGTSSGLGMGAILVPWVRVDDAASFTEGSARILVDTSGEFTWQRRGHATLEVQMRTPSGESSSNILTIPPR